MAGIQWRKKAYRLEPDTGKLSALTSAADSRRMPISRSTACIAMRAGIFWLGGSMGLFRFDPSTGAAQHYPHRSERNTGNIRGYHAG